MAKHLLVGAIALGLVLTALFWIDPLFLPLVLLGPPASGVLAALRGMPLRWIGLVWLVAGVGAVVSDFAVNQEDVLFHVVLTAIMVALAAVAWWIAHKLRPARPASA